MRKNVRVVLNPCYVPPIQHRKLGIGNDFLEYHETLSAAFGEQAEDNKHNAIKQYYGKYVLVVDGSIPVKDGGVYLYGRR